MIQTQNKRAAYQTTFSNADREALADAPIAKGGGGQGFGPHELLEAALAACLNMSVRMRASELGLQVDDVRTTVSVDRSLPSETIFNYTIHVDGPLTESQRAQLMAAAAECPVKKTLAKQLIFRAGS